LRRWGLGGYFRHINACEHLSAALHHILKLNTTAVLKFVYKEEEEEEETQHNVEKRSKTRKRQQEGEKYIEGMK
jgi:hypothetical protein